MLSSTHLKKLFSGFNSLSALADTMKNFLAEQSRKAMIILAKSFYRGKKMNGELYLKKGLLQLNKKLYDEALETLNKVIELDDDLASVTSAKCILGEYYFIHQNYEKAKEFLSWICDRQDELEEEFDDLLSEEIDTASVLMELIEKYKL